jgi:hypothetical protein
MTNRKTTERNRPLRVFEKVLQGGLGAGNLGVLLSSHGTGKLAVMTSLTVDKAMDGKNVLHVALGKSVSDIRAYRDEILNEIEESLDLQDRAEILSNVERHTQIYTFRNGALNLAKLAQTLDFLADHAEFRPELIEIQGWPDWRQAAPEEIRALKRFAGAAKCEIWMSVHTSPADIFDGRGVPDYLARSEDSLSVIVALKPEKEHTRIRFIKVHGAAPPSNVNLEFDPTTMLVRWR